MPIKLTHSIVFPLILIQILPVKSLPLEQPPKLILLQQFVRHGARYPTDLQGIVIDNYPNEKKGTLSDEGKRMSYLLGRQLFNQYWQSLFGPDKTLKIQKIKKYFDWINPQSWIMRGYLRIYYIIARSPRHHSTIQKFPYQFNLRPIYGAQNRRTHFLPISTQQYYFNESINGDFLLKHSAEACPMQKIWGTQNLIGQKYQYVFQNPRYKTIIKKMEESLNITIGGQHFLARYYSQIVSLKILRFQLPPFFYQTSPYFRDYKVCSAINFYLCYFGEQLQLRTQMSGMFDEITNNIKKKTELKDDYPSWFIYFIHQEEVGGFLAILDLMNVECMLKAMQTGEDSSDCETQIPKPCANIIFEFYQYSRSNKITFKVRYNGQYRKIYFCQNELECDVNTLYSWFQIWRLADVQKACAGQ